MRIPYRAIGWLVLVGAAAWADTTISLGSWAVVRGETVDVRVAVASPILKDLKLAVSWDPALVEVVPGSLWANSSRLYDEWLPGTPVLPESFLEVLPESATVQFRLHGESIGLTGWRVAAAAAGSAQEAVFGFTLRGLVRGTSALAFSGAPYARNMDPFYYDEAVTPVAGSALVYVPAGPVQIAPSGGSFSHAIEVGVTSENAVRVVYTLDGTEPDEGSPELSSGQALFLDGADGESIEVRALALGEAGEAQRGGAIFVFDRQAPAVTVAPCFTALGRPVLAGTVSEAEAVVAVTVDGATAQAVNHADGTWSLDLSGVLPGDLGEGVYDVLAVATDAAGNRADDGTTGELVVDRTPPRGVFEIGVGGPAWVSVRAVDLVLAVEGAEQMRFRNQGGDWSDWVSWAAGQGWTLLAGDGVKTVEAEFRDAAGNRLATSDAVTLDTGLPQSGITTVGTYGPLTWPGEISGTAVDGVSGVARVEVQCRRASDGAFWDGLAWGAESVWVTAAGTASWSLPMAGAALPDEVAVTVRSRAVDRAGNLQDPVASAVLMHDGTAPAGEFSIAGAGVVAVALPAVTLRSQVTGAQSMRFREGAGLWTAWLPYAAEHPWVLGAGDGRKTITAGYRDAAGNGLELSDDILLDQVAPVSSVGTAGGYGPGTWPGVVAGGVTDATSGVAVVVVSIRRQPDGDEEATWDGAGWVVGGAPVWLAADLDGVGWSVVLPLAALDDGRRYAVSARAEDPAGNVEAVASASSFVFDSTVPSGGFTLGAGNPLYVNAISVVLHCTVSAGDHDLEMRFRNDGEAFPATWVPYAATHAWTLPVGAGPKTVHGEFRDLSTGNILSTLDQVTLDQQAPAAALVLGSSTYGPLSWSGNLGGVVADDGPAGVARVEVSLLRQATQYWNGAGWQAAAFWITVEAVGGAWALPLTAADLAGGTNYLVRCRAVDRAGNEQAPPDEAGFTFDAEAPTGSFSIGVGQPAATASRSVLLAVAVDGAAEMSFCNAGAPWSDWEPLAATRDWQVLGGDGEKRVFGRFRDGVGNLLEVSDAILLDSAAPAAVLVMESVAGPQTWSGLVVGSASDNAGGSGLAQVEMRVQRSTDSAFWDGAGWVAGETWLQAAGTTAWQVSLPAAALASGVRFDVAVRAVDLAGNAQDPPALASVLYDAGLPVSAIGTPGTVGVTTWPGAVVGTASDAVSAVARVEVRVRQVRGGMVSYWDGQTWEPENDTLWLAATGTQSWRLDVPGAALAADAVYSVGSRAVDSAGNVQWPWALASFAYDGTPPAVPVLTGITADTGLAGDRVTSDRTLVFAGEAEAGSTVELRLQGVPIGSAVASLDGVWTYDHTGLPLAAGTYALAAAARDVAGNRSDWSAPWAITVDPVPPVLVGGLPGGMRVNGAQVILCDSDGLGALEGSVDQVQWVAVQSGVTVLSSLPGYAAVPQGAFTLSLRDVDLAGNEGRVAMALVNDTIPPQGYAMALSHGFLNAATSNALRVVLTGAEAGSVCEYRIADAAGGVLAGSFPVSAATQSSPSLDVGVLADGLLVVSVWLSDVANNRGAKITAEVTMDTEPPAGYSLALGQGAINAGNQGQLGFTVSDCEATAAGSFTVTSSGGGGSVAGVFAIAGAVASGGPVDVAGLPDGVLRVSVALTDSFGNRGQAAVAEVVKDTVPPAPPQVDTWSPVVTLATVGAFALAGLGEPLSEVLYAITSSGGGTPVAGGAPVGADGRFAVVGVDLAGLGDGTITLAVAGRDRVGNATASAPVGTAMKDTVVPQAPGLTAVTEVINAGTVAQMAFAGTGEPGASIDYALEAAGAPLQAINGSAAIDALGAFAVAGLDVAGLPDGLLRLRLWVRDGVGNVSAEVIREDIRKDTVAPVVALSVPAAGNAVNGSEVLTAAPTEPALWSLAIDGGAWVGFTPGVDRLQDVAPFAALGDGGFTLAVRAVDAAGNAATASLELHKDTALPAGYGVVLESDFIDQAVATTLAFTILDGEAGATYDYDLADDSGTGFTVTGSGPVTASPQAITGVPLAGLQPGTLTLRLRLRDPAGNAGPEVQAQGVLGSVRMVALRHGWNSLGVTLRPVDTAAAVQAEAAGRPDGALLVGAFHGFDGRGLVPHSGRLPLEFGQAYRVFAQRAGTLRLRGVPAAGFGTLRFGWNFVTAGQDAIWSELVPSALGWADERPGVGYRLLIEGDLLPGGEPVWLHRAP